MEKSLVDLTDHLIRKNNFHRSLQGESKKNFVLRVKLALQAGYISEIGDKKIMKIIECVRVSSKDVRLLNCKEGQYLFLVLSSGHGIESLRLLAAFYLACIMYDRINKKYSVRSGVPNFVW